MHMLLAVAAFTVASIGTGVVIFCATRLRRWDSIGKMIANRFGPGLSKPWILEMIISGSPRYRFRYRGIPCYLKIRSAGFLKRRPTVLSFSVDWPERSTAWLISTDESDRGRWLEQPIVLPGGDTFHKRFFVYGRDKKKVAHLITPPVQHALLQMLAKSGRRQLGNNAVEVDGLNLRSSRGRLTFRTTTASIDSRAVEKFMRCCLHVYDLMVLGAVEGLTYLEEDLTVIEDVVCPICSGTIEGDYVSCSSCQAPHCRDCWQYNGRCATFACMETDFVTGGVHCPLPLPLAELVDGVD